MSRNWFPALAASIGVAAGGYAAGALTGRAAFTATAVGTSTLRGGGWRAGVLLAAFFVSGSALPRMFGGGRRFTSDRVRDERQVLANGGAAALAGMLVPLIGERGTLAAIAGSLAAATADTWATEIGSTSKRPPRLILSRRPIEAGLSGGVTARGNGGALAGALFIAGLSMLLTRDKRLALAACLSGVAGATIDSVLGELVQARYRDAASGKLSETAGEDDASRQLVAGTRWIDNDVVNLACTASGGALALAIVGLGRSR